MFTAQTRPWEVYDGSPRPKTKTKHIPHRPMATSRLLDLPWVILNEDPSNTKITKRQASIVDDFFDGQ